MKPTPATLPGDDWKTEPDPTPDASTSTMILPPAENAPEVEPPNHFKSDIGYADAIVRRYGGTIRFCPDENCWLIFDPESGWHRDETKEIVDLVTKYARHLFVNALEAAKTMKEKEGEKLVAAMVDLGNQRRMIPAIKIAESSRSIIIRANDLDSDLDLVGVQNGVINLRTGAFSKHSQHKLVTRRLCCSYAVGAEAPTWNRFLERVQPDPEMRAFLARLAGYCLHGEVKDHVLPFHYGAGANGKGTFLEQALLKVAGSYGAKLTDSIVYQSERGTTPYLEIAGLCGKRLALGEENSEGGKLNESLLKAITGGDRVKGRFHHKDFLEYSPTYKIQLVGNHKPRIAGTDEGIWRRFLLIDWPVEIPPEERDRDLSAKLAAEMPGILNWAIAGARDWLDNALRPPVSCKEATDKFRKQSDALSDFIPECFTEDPDGYVSKADAFTRYQAWANANGLKHPISKRSLGNALVNHGWNETRVGKNRVDVWVGYKITIDLD